MTPQQAPPTLAVLKLGGEVVADPERLAAVLADVIELRARGWRFVLCHGGGPQTTGLGQRLGIEAVKVAGQRVTDAATLTVARQAIVGEVGTAVVAAAWAAGLPALGLVGVIHGRRRPPLAITSEGGRIVDYGLVGDVVRLELRALEACWAAEMTPVSSPIAVDVDAEPGGLLNINGDTVAAAIAAGLGADHLFVFTAVGGVLRDRNDPSSRIPKLSASETRAAIAEGVIAGGMIPKVEEALAALSGARAVHILAPEAGALVAEAAAPGSRGTMLVPGS